MSGHTAILTAVVRKAPCHAPLPNTSDTRLPLLMIPEL